MLRNSFNALNRGQGRLANFRPERMIHLSACVRCCNVCSSANQSSIIIVTKCAEFMCELYDCLCHLVKTVNVLLLRLHQTTCLLLRLTPASTNQVHHLPDILRDLNCRHTHSAGPDVIAKMPRACGPIQIDIAVTVHPSALELEKGCHKYGNYFNSNIGYPHQHIDNSIRYHPNSQYQCNNNLRHGKAGLDFIKVSNDYPSCDRKPRAGVQSPDSVTSNDKTFRKPCIGYVFSARKSDHSTHTILSFSGQSLSSQGSHQARGHDQKLVVPDSLQTQVPSCSQSNLIGEQDKVQDLQAGPHIELATPNIDREFTKDIVLALRSVGDNLDTRMRFKNEPSFQAVLGATKISAGWFLLMTLNQRNIIDVVTSLSLELLHQFIRL